jgi:RimJ/RimL family protein N-acetyltransferase
MGRSKSVDKGLAGRERNGFLSFNEIAGILDQPKRKLAVVGHDHEARRNGLRLVFDKDQDVAEFTASRLPHPIAVSDFGPFSTIGIADAAGGLIAGAIYHRWRKFDCELTFSATSPRWCRRGILRALFHYPFLQQGLERMTLIIGENNPRALKLNLGLGFKVEGRVRKAYDGKNDAFILGMMRDECRWIKESHDG